VDGAVTTFAWDWATGVPELLSDGDALYLVGHETLGWTDGATWRYTLPDALGSIRQTVDAAGAVVSVREWDPYGVEVGGAQAGFGYTGEWFDGDAELVYLRARWYDADAGRFTQKDPIAGLLSWGESYNAYGYAEQNSVNRVDPSGLLSNETIRKSFGVSRFEDVLAIIKLSGDWGYLKMLQDAKVGDRVYAGPFSWTSYLGTIECYDSSRHSPEPWYWPGPWEGGVVFITPNGEEHLVEQSKRMETYARPPDWYFLNNNQGPSPYTTKTDLGYLPDYIVGSAGYGFGVILGIGPNVQVFIDRFGNIYFGLAGEVGVGIPGLPSGGLALGWLHQTRIPADSRIPGPTELRGFIEGWGGGVAGYLLIGGSMGYNYSDRFPLEVFEQAIAFEEGIALPTFGWSFVGHTWWLGQKPWLEWDWVDTYPIRHGYGRQDIRLVDDRPADCGCR
jgi:RHS repeat-associated protein